MPYKSLAQERWAHTPEGSKALGGPSAVAEWDAATKGKKLPKRTGGLLGRALAKRTKRKKGK